jgi:hypothetical protein
MFELVFSAQYCVDGQDVVFQLLAVFVGAISFIATAQMRRATRPSRCIRVHAVAEEEDRLGQSRRCMSRARYVTTVKPLLSVKASWLDRVGAGFGDVVTR